MRANPMMQSRSERRREPRLQLTEPIVGRFGTSVIVIVDISPMGALIEHYSKLDRGLERGLRVQWGDDALGVRSRIVRSHIERFVPGDEGITVFRSGLQFDDTQLEEVARIRQLISNAVATTLVEQVANAKGFYTPHKKEMPIFRQGILTTNDAHLEQKLKKLLPNSTVLKDRGYLRLTLRGANWERKWTMNPSQPEGDGFTISASEMTEEVDLLCHTYLNANRDGRNLIRNLAQMSLGDREEK